MRRAALALLAALLAGPAGAQTAKPAATPPPKSASADFVFPGPAEPLPATLRAAVDGLRAEALAAHVRFLASPALEGRGLGTHGLDAALEYAAVQLALAGVEPYGSEGAAGKGRGWFQPVPMREILEPGGSVELERRSGEGRESRSFRHGVDVVVPVQSPRSVSGPVVFAGYGVREAEPARDDYRGLDVKGKVVLIREGLPPGEAWRTKALRARWAEGDSEERWAEKVKLAKSLGAAAVLAVEGEEWTARLAGKEKPAAFAFRSVDEAPNGETLLVRGAPAVLESLLGFAPKPEEAPRALPGVTATLRATAVERLGLSRNVIGILPGSDPKRMGEAVVLGAHADHLGRVDGVTYPGADDNASGVSALLEIARAFATSSVRPKRTLVFAVWTGEEEDKIGSAHWVGNPRWPLAKTVAYLNFDMIAHPWLAKEIRALVTEAGLPDAEGLFSRTRPEELVEPGLASYAPELGPVLARAGRNVGLTLHLDWTEGVHGGSDYKAFARARVPFVRFFGSFFPDYHQPGDTAESVDPAQVLRVARLGLAAAGLLADR